MPETASYDISSTTNLLSDNITSEFLGSLNLVSDDFVSDLESDTNLQSESYYSDIDSSTKLVSDDYSTNFSGSTSVTLDQYTTDLSGTTRFVLNSVESDINGTTSISAINVNSFISGSVNLVDIMKEDISGSASIQKESYSYDFNSSGNLINSSVYSDMDSKVYLDKIIQTNDMVSTASILKESYTADSIIGVTNIQKESYDSDILNANISIAYRYIDPNKDLIGSVSLSNTHNFYEFDGSTRVLTNSLWQDILIQGLRINKLDWKLDIPMKINISKNNFYSDCLSGTVNLVDCNFIKYIGCNLIIPKYKFKTDLQSTINIVIPVNHHILCRIDVDNPNVAEFNGYSNLLYDNINIDISGSTRLKDYTISDINSSVNLSPINTIRDLDCFAHLTGRKYLDILSKIKVENNNILNTVYQDINCSLITGYNNHYELNCSINIPYKYSKDINLLINIPVHKLPSTNVGIIVDPRWTYEPFVFKSSLITLLDIIAKKYSLHIIYGGNNRSNFDIDRLGKAYKASLIKIPIPDYHIYDNPYQCAKIIGDYRLDRVFIFAEKVSLQYSPFISTLTNRFINRNISTLLISSDGSFIELNKKYNTSSEFDKKDNLIVY